MTFSKNSAAKNQQVIRQSTDSAATHKFSHLTSHRDTISKYQADSKNDKVIGGHLASEPFESSENELEM
jgi:hypothetical protein